MTRKEWTTARLILNRVQQAKGDARMRIGSRTDSLCSSAWTNVIAVAFAGLVVSGCSGGTVPTREKLAPGELVGAGARDMLAQDEVLRPVNAKGLALTKRSEGFEPRLYNDTAGYCTIAYGRLIKKSHCDESEPPEFKKGVSEPEGAEILVRDMASAQVTVMHAVKVALSHNQFSALTDFVCNVGGANFRSSTLLRKVNGGHFEDVPTQLRRWVFAGGKLWPGLKTRREEEITLFFDGGPTPKTFQVLAKVYRRSISRQARQIRCDGEPSR
ncbi:lysozyme [Lysobacter antibioticus]|uniref:lysozyme n=1 Tax=Lysobacter antibioticus TaxID=84531 RepID=UPI0031F3082D